jgi:hypothetical protein
MARITLFHGGDGKCGETDLFLDDVHTVGWKEGGKGVSSTPSWVLRAA